MGFRMMEPSTIVSAICFCFYSISSFFSYSSKLGTSYLLCFLSHQSCENPLSSVSCILVDHGDLRYFALSCTWRRRERRRETRETRKFERRTSLARHWSKNSTCKVSETATLLQCHGFNVDHMYIHIYYPRDGGNNAMVGETKQWLDQGHVFLLWAFFLFDR